MANESFHSSINAQFKVFLSDLFVQIGLDRDERTHLLDSRSFNRFVEAFTHISFNSRKNYEFLEFFGDKIVNALLSIYITETYPSIQNVDLLTRLIHKIQSEQYLSQFSEDLHFWDYALIQEKEQKNEEERREILCDLFESFIGALFRGFDEIEGRSGFQRFYPFLKSLCDTHPIHFDHLDFQDEITKLKEYFNKIHFDLRFFTREISQEEKFSSDNTEPRRQNPLYYAEITGPSETDSFRLFNGKRKLTIVGRGKASTKEEAKRLAAREALSYFGIFSLGYVLPKYDKDVKYSNSNEDTESYPSNNGQEFEVPDSNLQIQKTHPRKESQNSNSRAPSPSHDVKVTHQATSHVQNTEVRKVEPSLDLESIRNFFPVETKVSSSQSEGSSISHHKYPSRRARE